MKTWGWGWFRVCVWSEESSQDSKQGLSEWSQGRVDGIGGVQVIFGGKKSAMEGFAVRRGWQGRLGCTTACAAGRYFKDPERSNPLDAWK